jgi:hypothetical protein
MTTSPQTVPTESLFSATANPTPATLATTETPAMHPRTKRHLRRIMRPIATLAIEYATALLLAVAAVVVIVAVA